MTKLAIALAVLLISASTWAAQPADGYPNRPVRLIVGVPPGSGADTVTRAIALRLTETWGRSVVVDNRPGAGGSIAMDLTVKAAPDGYTLLSASVGLVATAKPLKKVPYEAIDVYQPIIQMTSQPYIIIASPNAPFNTVQELLNVSREKPGSLNYASSGTGSASHLGTELFKSMAKINMVHVPYKGLAQAMNEVSSGQVQVLFSTVVTAMPFIKSNRIKVVAVTVPQRLKTFPNVPTVMESGLPGYELSSAYALYAPKKTPRPLLEKINHDVAALLEAPDVRARMSADGADVAERNTVAQFERTFVKETERWNTLFRTTSLTVE